MANYDKNFLEKMSGKQTYYSDHIEYRKSIIQEIGNILSSRLKKLSSESVRGPYDYGIRDLLSQEISQDGLDVFRLNCQKAIKELEPRIIDIEITELRINQEKQMLELSIACVLNSGRFNSKVVISSK